MKTSKAVSRSLLASIIPLALVAVACGGNKPEPATSAPSSPPETAPVSETDAASGAAPAPSEAAPTTAATPAEAPAAGSEPGAPAAKPGGVIVGETKDECTPVGVDFEKRARPKLKECYAEGKKKKPDLEGTVKIKITVDVKGKIKSTKIIEKTLPDPVAECMLKVIKTTPFPEVDKCWDATLTIPVTFPTPK
jgi:hypothetical protein